MNLLLHMMHGIPLTIREKNPSKDSSGTVTVMRSVTG